MRRFDAIVAGGGISGSSSAVALARAGLNVLVCESGLPDERRLAGELMHPPAAADLAALGLLAPLERAGGVPVYGFVVLQGPDDPGAVLSYSEIPQARPTGLAIDHALMTRTLLAHAETLPNVEVWVGARVLDADYGDTHAVVTVKRDGQKLQARAPLVVSAEGRASKLRRAAGIEAERSTALHMIGWRIPRARLPYPGYGHVFLGGCATALAYQMARDDVRVMFELPVGGGTEVPADLLAVLPQPFRDDVVAHMSKEPGQVAKVFALATDRYTSQRLAIVGDAGGCAHPLTASGISYCVGDARRLAQSVARAGADGPRGTRVPQALAEYERTRIRHSRTRGMLASSLHDAFFADEPAMRLLRHGLFRYWSRSARGRRASLGLLSTRDTGLHQMAMQYAGVSMHAIAGLRDGVVPPGEILPAMGGLLRRNVRYLGRLVPLSLLRSGRASVPRTS